MNISFHGAARVVTGSKHVIQLDNGKKLLLDCGMFQGHPQEADRLNRIWGFEPAEIDYMVLSHAHIDHCGLIPKLVKDGFRGNIYCTPATFDMSKILMCDSARIQEGDTYYLNKRLARQKKPLIESLYTEADVEAALPHFKTVEYHEPFHICDGAELLFTDAGHIIGSAVVNLKLKKSPHPQPGPQTREGGLNTSADAAVKAPFGLGTAEEIRLTFSGDVGRYGDDIIKSPEPFPQADIILCESTYGDKLHEPSELTGKKLLDIIVDTCLKKHGNLIIPAFSVGRTQEIIYALSRLDQAHILPPLDFFIDSPLSLEATEVTKAHPECFNEKLLKFMETDPTPFDFKRLQYIRDVEASKALNDRKEPCVIISASGMADAGRVKHHIAHNIGDRRNTILLVGYCEPNSLGARLGRGMKEVTIFGEPYEVRAEIKELRSFSAHGDYEDLMQFLSCQDASQVKKLFLVHGEYDVQQVFRSKLLKRGFKTIEIPEQHQVYEI